MANQFLQKTNSPVTWDHFTRMGEEHILAFTALSDVQMHSMHIYLQIQLYALENFLKGYNLYLNNSSTAAFEAGFKAGHNIEKLIALCRADDPKFVDWLNIVPKEVRNLPEDEIPDDQLKNMYTDPEFYTMLVQGQDLKYSGTTKDGKKFKIILAGESCTVKRVIGEIMGKIEDYKTSSNYERYIGPIGVTGSHKERLINYFRRD